MSFHNTKHRQHKPLWGTSAITLDKDITESSGCERIPRAEQDALTTMGQHDRTRYNKQARVRGSVGAEAGKRLKKEISWS